MKAVPARARSLGSASTGGARRRRWGWRRARARPRGLEERLAELGRLVSVLLVDEDDEGVGLVLLIARGVGGGDGGGVVADGGRAGGDVEGHLWKTNRAGRRATGRHARGRSARWRPRDGAPRPPRRRSTTRRWCPRGRRSEPRRTRRRRRSRPRCTGGSAPPPPPRVVQQLVGHLQRHARVAARADPSGGGVQLVRIVQMRGLLPTSPPSAQRHRERRARRERAPSRIPQQREKCATGENLSRARRQAASPVDFRTQLCHSNVLVSPSSTLRARGPLAPGIITTPNLRSHLVPSSSPRLRVVAGCSRPRSLPDALVPLVSLPLGEDPSNLRGGVQVEVLRALPTFDARQAESGTVFLRGRWGERAKSAGLSRPEGG